MCVNIADKIRIISYYKHGVGTDVGKMCDKRLSFGEKHVSNVYKQ